jgi:hypothetical protein
MVDWRNVKIYRAAAQLEEEACEAKDILGRLEELSEFQRSVEKKSSMVEERLRNVDQEIMRRMEKLTVLPVSSLWRASRGLLDKALMESGYRKVAMVLLSDALLDYTEEMLEREDIIARLEFALF